jgi:hypothetical protein
MRAAILCAGLLLVGQACAVSTGPIVMVSGRDDHGLLARPAIGIQPSPTDIAVVASVPDGAFVRVLRTQGSWLLVRTVEATPKEGWIDDHYLRDAAVLDGTTRVSFKDADVRGDETWVLVAAPGGDRWVPARALREVGAR